jgi:hypothetical protein
MRKAVWGAILLGAFALTLVSPIREQGAWHRPLGSISLIAGYILLSLDPPEASQRQRNLVIAGILCSLASFVLAFLPLPYVANVLARLLSVGVIALPLWLAARWFRSGFIAAGVLALATLLPALEEAGGAATSLHGYVAALSAIGTALVLHKINLFTKQGSGRPPRVVTARDVVFLSPEEKAERLAALEKRFQAGEIPEHKYWDRRQEIESR